MCVLKCCTCSRGFCLHHGQHPDRPCKSLARHYSLRISRVKRNVISGNQVACRLQTTEVTVRIAHFRQLSACEYHEEQSAYYKCLIFCSQIYTTIDDFALI